MSPDRQSSTVRILTLLKHLAPSKGASVSTVSFPTLPSAGYGEFPYEIKSSPKSPIGLQNWLDIDGLTNYLLNQNTLFHAKVGFYEPIMRKILHQSGQPPVEKFDYILKASRLRQLQMKAMDRLILLPVVSSTKILDDFVAGALSHKISPVWLIAYPKMVSRHLLSAFHNFFLMGNSGDDLSFLQDIFSFKATDLRILETEAKGFLITDYAPVVEQESSPTVVILDL